MLGPILTTSATISSGTNSNVTTDDVFADFKLHFPNATIYEQHGNFLNIHINTSTNVISTIVSTDSTTQSTSTATNTNTFNLAEAFYYLQNLKDKEGKILDYSITQATLEQIFVDFAGGDPNLQISKST